MDKQYRFFYHYRRSDRKMSVHYKNQCMPCSDVICNVPCETKRNRIQPYLVLRGFATSVRYEGDKVIIE